MTFWVYDMPVCQYDSIVEYVSMEEWMYICNINPPPLYNSDHLPHVLGPRLALYALLFLVQDAKIPTHSS